MMWSSIMRFPVPKKERFQQATVSIENNINIKPLTSLKAV